MKIKNKLITLTLFSLIFFTPISYGASYNTFMVTYGGYKFIKSDQSLKRAYSKYEDCLFLGVLCTTYYNYEKAALVLSKQYENMAGIRYEHGFRNGLIMETKVGYAQSSYIMQPTSVTGISGDGRISFVMGSAALKHYFNEEGLLQPYLSAGLGIIAATFSEPVDTTVDDFVLPMSIGITTKIAQYGMFLDYTYAPQIFQTNYTYSSDGIGHFSGNLNLGGTAITLGVSRMF